MPSVEVDARTAQALQLAARIAGISPGDVVRRLVDSIRPVVDINTAAVWDVQRSRVPIRAEYQGVATQAVFDPVTEGVEIVSGPLAGTVHNSPSSAARSVVAYQNPSVNPSRNGWTFWLQDGDGSPLRGLRRG